MLKISKLLWKNIYGDDVVNFYQFYDVLDSGNADLITADLYTGTQYISTARDDLKRVGDERIFNITFDDIDYITIRYGMPILMLEGSCSQYSI